MTITARGELDVLEQIKKQANKLVDVVHVIEHTEKDSVETELSLLKLQPQKVDQFLQYVNRIHGKILDQSDGCFVLQLSGKTADIDEWHTELAKYQIMEIVRTGKLVIACGKEST